MKLFSMLRDKSEFSFSPKEDDPIFSLFKKVIVAHE